MPSLNTVLAVATVIAVTPGCGSKQGTGSSGDKLHGGSNPQGEYDARFCERAFECRKESWGGDFEEFFPDSLEECAALGAPDEAEARLASERAGRILYDNAAIERCRHKIVALETMTCQELWKSFNPEAWPLACDGALSGTIPNGGACTIGLDCDYYVCRDGVCSEAAE